MSLEEMFSNSLRFLLFTFLALDSTAFFSSVFDLQSSLVQINQQIVFRARGSIYIVDTLLHDSSYLTKKNLSLKPDWAEWYRVVGYTFLSPTFKLSKSTFLLFMIFLLCVVLLCVFFLFSCKHIHLCLERSCSDSTAICLSSLFLQSDISHRYPHCFKHLTIFLFPGAQSPVLIISLPLTPSGHHLITEQGARQCFLIMLSLPSGHHLMMKNLLQEVRTFVLLLFSSFLFCHGGVCLCVFVYVGSGGGVFVHSQLFFIYLFFLSYFAPRLEIWCPELECAISLFHTSG